MLRLVFILCILAIGPGYVFAEDLEKHSALPHTLPATNGRPQPIKTLATPAHQQMQRAATEFMQNNCAAVLAHLKLHSDLAQPQFAPLLVHLDAIYVQRQAEAKASASNQRVQPRVEYYQRNVDDFRRSCEQRGRAKTPTRH